MAAVPVSAVCKVSNLFKDTYRLREGAGRWTCFTNYEQLLEPIYDFVQILCVGPVKGVY